MRVKISNVLDAVRTAVLDGHEQFPTVRFMLNPTDSNELTARGNNYYCGWFVGHGFVSFMHPKYSRPGASKRPPQ